MKRTLKIAVVAVACIVSLLFSVPLLSASASTITGTYTDTSNGVDFTYSITDGRLTITGITKSADNANATFQVYIPETITDNGTPYPVYAIGANALGTQVSAGVGGAIDYTTNTQITKVVVPYTITSIGDSAFAGCTALADVQFSADGDGNTRLKSIGDYAFMHTGIQTLTMPNTVSQVGKFAFYSCPSLTELKLPATQTSWDNPVSTFASDGALVTITVPEGCTVMPQFSQCCNLTSLSLPSTITGTVSVQGSTHLTLKAFPANAAIDSLCLSGIDDEEFTVPAGVKSLTLLAGSYTTLNLPDTLDTIERISGNASLEKIQIPPSVVSIESYAFTGDSALKEVTFGDGSTLSELGARAFYQCASLVNIQLPNSIKRLSGFPFDGCASLTSIELPASLDRVGSVFKDCAALQTIKFDSETSLESLGNLTYNCTDLRTVYLPANIGSINRSALLWWGLINNAPLLEAVYTYDPDLQLDASDFVGCPSSFKLYGWGADGAVLNFAENQGLQFIPYAELDSSQHSGKTNCSESVNAANVLSITCKFSMSSSYDYSRVLDSGNDYTVAAVSGSDGNSLRITGNGTTCFGAITLPCLRDISGAQITSIATQIYSGTALTPKPTVTYNGSILTEGIDYTLSYSGNDQVGTATITVNGIGAYCGSNSSSFQVKAASEISGSSRADNALKASADVTQASTVIFVKDYDYATVLTADALSAAAGYPIVSVGDGALSQALLSQLSKWGTTKVLLVGSSATDTSLSASIGSAGMAHAAIEGTSASSIAQSVYAYGHAQGIWGTAAVVTTSDDAALGLCAASYASSIGAPLFYTGESGALDASAVKELSGFSRVVIVGTAEQVDASADPSIAGSVRIAGTDDVETAELLAEYGVRNGTYKDCTSLYITTTADATSFLPWAANAGKQHAPLLLIDAQHAIPYSFISAHAGTLTSYRILDRQAGSQSAVNAQVLQALGW